MNTTENTTKATPAGFSLINSATGKPKKNSMWRGDKQRPTAWFLKGSTKKVTKKDNPYKNLPESALQYNLRHRGSSVGISFHKKEILEWIRESHSHKEAFTITSSLYTLPAGLSHS